MVNVVAFVAHPVFLVGTLVEVLVNMFVPCAVLPDSNLHLFLWRTISVGIADLRELLIVLALASDELDWLGLQD